VRVVQIVAAVLQAVIVVMGAGANNNEAFAEAFLGQTAQMRVNVLV
jgi:hypothetical protein